VQLSETSKRLHVVKGMNRVSDNVEAGNMRNSERSHRCEG